MHRLNPDIRDAHSYQPAPAEATLAQKKNYLEKLPFQQRALNFTNRKLGDNHFSISDKEARLLSIESFAVKILSSHRP